MRTRSFYVPTDAVEPAHHALAERPERLEGLRLGVLDNGKEFSDRVLSAAAAIVQRDQGVAEIVRWEKGFPAKAAPFIEAMAEGCDLVLNGVGHCGSSSPWSVYDAVALEKAGVPTVTLISRNFCLLGQVVARRLGVPGLPIVVLPHPVGDSDDAEVCRKGTDAVAESVRLLTTAGPLVDEEFQRLALPLQEHAVAKQ